MMDEVFAPGMSATAAPLLRRGEPIGVINIADSRLRLTQQRMDELRPALLSAGAELGSVSLASSLFGRSALGEGARVGLHCCSRASSLMASSMACSSGAKRLAFSGRSSTMKNSEK